MRDFIVGESSGFDNYFPEVRSIGISGVLVAGLKEF
jgi:hypothetical protein